MKLKFCLHEILVRYENLSNNFLPAKFVRNSESPTGRNSSLARTPESFRLPAYARTKVGRDGDQHSSATETDCGKWHNFLETCSFIPVFQPPRSISNSCSSFMPSFIVSFILLMNKWALLQSGSPVFLRQFKVMRVMSKNICLAVKKTGYPVTNWYIFVPGIADRIHDKLLVL